MNTLREVFMSILAMLAMLGVMALAPVFLLGDLALLIAVGVPLYILLCIVIAVVYLWEIVSIATGPVSRLFRKNTEPDLERR